MDGQAFSRLSETEKGGEVLDASSKTILPGLVNCDRMGSGRANPLTLRKYCHKNKHNLASGGQFWYQNPPFKEITIKWLEQKGTIFQDTYGI